MLSEHEVTHLITLVTAIAKQMGIKDAENPELNELENDVHPEKVMDKIESYKEAGNLSPNKSKDH